MDNKKLRELIDRVAPTTFRPGEGDDTPEEFKKRIKTLKVNTPLDRQSEENAIDFLNGRRHNETRR